MFASLLRSRCLIGVSWAMEGRRRFFAASFHICFLHSGRYLGFGLYEFVASNGVAVVVVLLLNTPGVLGVYGRSLAASHSNEIPLASARMDGDRVHVGFAWEAFGMGGVRHGRCSAWEVLNIGGVQQAWELFSIEAFGHWRPPARHKGLGTEGEFPRGGVMGVMEAV